jgi:ethanolamine kinase
MSSFTDLQPRVDSPMAITYIPLTFDNGDADECALELAYAYNPSWKTSEGVVDIVRFTDGITNTLSKATKRRPGKTESQNDDDAILSACNGWQELLYL